MSATHQPILAIPAPLIGVMGASLGTGNRGVSALSASLIKLLGQSVPGCEIRLMIGHRDHESFRLQTVTGERLIPVVNYRQSPKSAWRDQLAVIVLGALVYRMIPCAPLRRWLARQLPWISASERARQVGDIRGGDSFSDIYGLRRFVLASLPVMASIWVRGAIVLFPQTYGPFRNGLARRVARWILGRASKIVARDREGLEVIRQLIGPVDKVRFCPDVAFTLDPIRPARLEIAPPVDLDSVGTLVGLNVNGLMFQGGYTRNNMFGMRMDYPDFLRQLLIAFLEQTDAHLLLVPHTFGAPDDVESDPEASRRVMAMVPPEHAGRVHLVTSEHDQSEVKWVIGRCGFFVGSRMHSCIAALSQAIPAVGVAYSKKFRGVFDSVGVADWVVDGRAVDAPQAVQRVLELFRQRKQAQGTLLDQVVQARAKLSETFQWLFHEGP